MRNAECGTRNERDGMRRASRDRKVAWAFGGGERERARCAGFAGGLARRLSGAARFHRDERGATLDYVLVLVVFVPLAVFVIAKLFEVLSDYFGMIAFYVTWPFL